VLYLTTLGLLPWSWFPPFPWIHQHAQWSDLVFAAAALAWIVEKVLQRERPALHSTHIALALYAAFAVFSFLFTATDWRSGAPKLFGIGELCILALITSELARRPGAMPLMGRVIAITSLLTAAAGIAGIILFYFGIKTRLLGTYGDLVPSSNYARIQAGFYQPNLLASYCIFAGAVINCRQSQLPVWLRRATTVALWLAVLMTLSRGILAFGLAAAIRRADTRFRRIAVSLFAAFCAVVIVALSIWNLLVDPSSPLGARLDSSTPTSRWSGLTSSLRTLAVNPVFGTGPNTRPGQYLGFPFDAHLTPLNIAATLGLPALMAFVYLCARLWRQRGRPTDKAIWGGLAGLGLDALAQDVEDFRHVWVTIGLADANSEKAPATTLTFIKQQGTQQNRVLK
jgi:hypothetical protein